MRDEESASMSDTITNTIDPCELATVIGGAGKYFENIRGEGGKILNGPSAISQSKKNWGDQISESVMKNTDRTIAPWKLFNGIFGGARGPGQVTPPPPRPSYR